MFKFSLLKGQSSLTNLPSAMLLTCSWLLGAVLYISGLEGRESSSMPNTRGYILLQKVQFCCIWKEVEWL